MNIKPKTVLIIEDEVPQAVYLARTLDKADYAPVVLYSYESAFDSFKKLTEKELDYIEGIIFDYVLEGMSNSEPLVKTMVGLGYKGVMLANSSSRKCNEELLKIGCTHVRPGTDKMTAATYMISLLQG